MSLGGGQQTGGTVIQQVNPASAMQAGALQAQAAQEASNAYTTSVNQAMQQLNQQYQAAVSNLNPTSQAGMQALDQLNQYLGLNPESIAKPTAPISPTIGDAAAANYILQNSHIVNDDPMGNATYVYSGLGAQGVAPGDFIGGYLTAGSPGPSGSSAAGSATYSNGTPTTPLTGAYGYGMSNPLVGNQGLLNAVNQALTQQALADPTSTLSQQYAQAQQTYNQQLANYNQDQQWMQQYGTPLTSAQITQNVTNQPGYQAQLNAGVDAIQRASSANGQLGGSGMLANLMNFGQNQMSTYYGNMLGQLAQIAGLGQTATNNQANLTTSLGNNTANLLSNLGNQQGNALLAAGNAQANALTAANTNYNIIGQQSTGSNLSGLGSLLGGGAQLASSLSGLFGA